jgi:preprotein translocase SecE subunit
VNTATIITAVVTLAIFFWLWRAGHLMRFRNYVLATREELRKCNWPGREELKGSTMVVIVSVALLGAFTVLADLVLVNLVRNFLLKL